MAGTSKVIVLDPDMRAGRQLRLGFEREGVPAVALDANATELGATPDLVVVGGSDGQGLELVRRVRTMLEAGGHDVPIVFAGRHARPTEIEAAGADEIVLRPAYLRDVVTIGRIFRGRPAAVRSELSGSLAETTGVFNLVRALSALGRSAVLTLIRGLRRGEVRFFHGEVTSAQVGLIHGQAALHQLLLWTDARFDFRHEDVVRRQQIPLSPEELFADAERFLAGVREESGKLSPSMVMEQDIARIHSLGRQIPTEVHGVLRMFDGHRVLADILEDSPYRVFETLRVAQRALEAGLLRVTESTKGRASWRAMLSIEEWLVGGETKDAVAERVEALSPAERDSSEQLPTGKGKGGKRGRKKKRANTPISLQLPKMEIDWGALVPRVVGAEVGPLAGVVPAAAASGEIASREPREKLEALMNTGAREKMFPSELGPKIIVDDDAGDREAKARADMPTARLDAGKLASEVAAIAAEQQAAEQAAADEKTAAENAAADHAAARKAADKAAAETQAADHEAAREKAAAEKAGAEKAAAEQAAAEKAAAEKQAAEQAAAEQAAAEKQAAEQAAAENQAAEKAAAEKAAAEKAAAEKAAAEEAAAEKAAADEKAAAEKAAAEKAAADEKAVAEKAAAEKAAAEKAAADEKAAAERAAADEKAAAEKAAAEKQAADEKAAAERQAADDRAAAERQLADERAAAAKAAAVKAAADQAVAEDKAALEKAAAEEESTLKAEAKAARARAEARAKAEVDAADAAAQEKQQADDQLAADAALARAEQLAEVAENARMLAEANRAAEAEITNPRARTSSVDLANQAGETLTERLRRDAQERQAAGDRARADADSWSTAFQRADAAVAEDAVLAVAETVTTTPFQRPDPIQIATAAVTIAETDSSRITVHDQLAVDTRGDTALLTSTPIISVSPKVPTRAITPAVGVPVTAAAGAREAAGAPQSIDDEPSDGVVRPFSTVETAPIAAPRRPLPGSIPEDDRPKDTGGEIGAGRIRESTVAVEAGPTILIEEVAAGRGSLAEGRGGSSNEATPEASAAVESVRADAAAAFTDDEEAFFKLHETGAAPRVSLDEIDENPYETKPSFWERLLKRKPPKT